MVGRYSEAIEQKFLALAYSRDSGDWERKGPKERALFGKAERWALRVADSYFWASNVLRVVQVSSESLPDDTRIRVPQIDGAGAMWWWFEEPIDIGGLHGSIAAVLLFLANPDGDHDRARVVAINTYGTTDGVHFEVKDSVTFNEFFSLADLVRGGTAETSDWDTPSIAKPDNETGWLRLIRIVVSCLLWIEQRILVSSPRPIERHARKRLMRAGIEPSDVRVVVLRRRDYESVPSEGAAKHVEWTCQWIVGGHWRQQFYPSTDERKPLWIMPYVKGPEDKPLKVPGQSVYVVNR